ncbi:MAG: anthranilate phosphoribosyltransferase [Candidatus Gastranaerophilaceae bacterium]
MKSTIQKLLKNGDLGFLEIKEIVRSIANKEVSDAQIGAFLVAVTKKGVSKDEFFAFACAMREFSNRVILDKYVVDSCGTGADLSKTINISTASAIVANACGVNVLKQTNSAITSSCGSTDLLKALDIDVVKTAQDAENEFNKNNIAFVHSPYFNEFARINNPIRQQIGIKTIFNYLGPLINPAFPNAQLLGVSSFEMCEKIIYALQKLGTDRALVVNGLNPNIDEISICSKTAVYELKEGEISYYEISPEDFGFKIVDISEIQGGNGIQNAQIIQDIFRGEIKGAKLEVICMNAGAMIYLAGLKPNIFEGTKFAQEAIESGLAYENLLKLQGICSKCS